VIVWHHWPAAKPGAADALAEEWIAQTEFGTVQVIRSRSKSFRGPWAINYPTGDKQRAETASKARRRVGQWVAEQSQQQGAREPKDQK